MPSRGFKDLRIFQLAEGLSDIVWAIVLTWDTFAKDTVGKQLIRAADSIGANIAEGVGRFSRADMRRFMLISRGSLNETQFWLRCACKRKLLTKEQIQACKTILDELPPKLNAYIKSLTKPKKLSLSGKLPTKTND